MQVKDLDTTGENDITLAEFLGASKILLTYVKRYHGAERAEDLKAHFEIVENFAAVKPWHLCREYDIKQRKNLGNDSALDVSVRNMDTWLEVIAEAALVASSAPVAAAPSLPLKRRLSGTDREPFRPAKRRSDTSSMLCFRCGRVGHLPADCQAQTTVAGRPVVAHAPRHLARSPQALLAPNGKAGRLLCLCSRVGLHYGELQPLARLHSLSRREAWRAGLQGRIALLTRGGSSRPWTPTASRPSCGSLVSWTSGGMWWTAYGAASTSGQMLPFPSRLSSPTTSPRSWWVVQSRVPYASL